MTRGRILVIDDEPLLLRMMQRMLRDHDVTVYDNAKRALEAITAGGEFDLIFSDLMMPQMTGMEFYESLCTSNPMAASRIVFMTGGVTSVKVAQFLTGAPNRSFEKPVMVAELRDFIARELTRNS